MAQAELAIKARQVDKLDPYGITGPKGKRLVQTVLGIENGETRFRNFNENHDPETGQFSEGGGSGGGGGSSGGGSAGSGGSGGSSSKGGNDGGATLSVGGHDIGIGEDEYVTDAYKRATGKDMEFDGTHGVDVRYTGSDKDPMSEYGHAMFVNADKEDRVLGYGDNRWAYDRSSGTDVEDLKSDFISKWDEDRESGLIPQSDVGADFNDISGEEIWSSVNPKDIVDSAGFWDEGKLMQWYYERVAEPNGVGAINTQDGSIVWDKDLIKNIGKGVK